MYGSKVIPESRFGSKSEKSRTPNVFGDYSIPKFFKINKNLVTSVKKLVEFEFLVRFSKKIIIFLLGYNLPNHHPISITYEPNKFLIFLIRFLGEESFQTSPRLYSAGEKRPRYSFFIENFVFFLKI